MLKLYRVYDGKSYIGAYRAKNEKSAIRRAQEETNVASNFFKKSQPAIVFKAMRAEEVTESV